MTSTHLIRDKKDIHDLDEVDPTLDFIIAIEQDTLRNSTIQQVKKIRRDYIVLMHEIEANRAVRIDNIIYSSMHFSVHPFQQLMRFYRALRTHSFTRREYDVLKLFHLENHEIAKKLQLSQKTTSTYRVKILEKLNMRAKNILAMSRVKSAIVDQKL
ncbi:MULTISPECIES: LuxR C-terminal-related transcriptional regulator [Enterobacter]|nr:MULTISPECIES: LuxR C-terminal-related transcriptional regulator [Enterobacter]MDH1126131.1 LuxR C-terminal-related transcriptional regulator [Enterobacter sp. GD03975]MEA3783634.1 LuxR C-terminal-related transcriptional regulator [Enterobacter quasihormaechei]MEA3869475.1 LuxR C-terminal-related transcriptional regulator [Enterobacter quasihormaechei]